MLHALVEVVILIATSLSGGSDCSEGARPDAWPFLRQQLTGRLGRPGIKPLETRVAVDGGTVFGEGDVAGVGASYRSEVKLRLYASPTSSGRRRGFRQEASRGTAVYATEGIRF